MRWPRVSHPKPVPSAPGALFPARSRHIPIGAGFHNKTDSPAGPNHNPAQPTPNQ